MAPPPPAPAGPDDPLEPSSEPRPREAGSGPAVALREHLRESLPFLAGGALCLGIAGLLVHGPPHLLGLRLPLWPLLGGVGLTLVGGGCALTLTEEPPQVGADLAGGEFVLVNRGVWLNLQTAVVRAHEAAAAGAAQPPWAETPVEPPDPSAPLWVAPAVVDAASVESASRELLRAAHPPGVRPAGTPRSVPPAPLDVSGSAATPEALGAPPGASPGVRPPATAPSPPRPTTSTVTTEEFTSVLSLLERAEASVRSRIVRPPPVGARDRCTGCGISVSAYSEQLCVMCDRPLCDRCVDLTAASGHPQMCDTCHHAFRTGVT